MNKRHSPDAASSNTDELLGKLWFRSGKRLPIIRQVEKGECGLACLAMLSGYHGKSMSLSDVRGLATASLMGTSLSSLIETASILQMTCRPVRLEIHEVSQLKLPCVLHWTMDHFVVLKKISSKRAVIHDPAVGARTVTLKEFSGSFTGVALEVDAATHFQRMDPPPPISLRKLAGPVDGLWKGLTNVLLMALALEAVSLLMPQFIQSVLDQVVSNADADLLVLLGVGFGLLLIFQVSVTAMRAWTINWINANLSLQWTANLFQHLLRLPQTYFLRRHTGDVVARFGAIGSVQQVITNQSIGGVLDGLMASLTAIMLLIYSPLVALFPIVAAGAYLGSRLTYFRVFQEANLSQIVVNARQQTALLESIRSTQTVRLANKVETQTAKFANLSADVVNTNVQVQRYSMLFAAFNGLIAGGQRIAVLWFGAKLTLEGHFTGGMLMATAAYADQFASRASSFIDFLLQFRLLRLQTERLADIALTMPEPGIVGAYLGPDPDSSVTLSGVAFRYSDADPLILKSCSLHVNAGEFVAIVGPSGGGKSTLSKVIAGLLDPSLGDVAFGGISLKQLGKRRMRDFVSCVMQDDVLLSGTIAENISFFSEDASFEAVEQAARMAGIHEDIMAMPMAYRTYVGDMGSSLSGGQRQRVLLARALYRKPRILILDEATSNLDVVREQEVLRAISGLNVTRILISHRPESVAAVDRVFLLDGGLIKELHRDGPQHRKEMSNVIA